jgi:phenylalanyl-tRNA synthetase beta chain
MVKMLNSLSAELNILRSSLLETALEVVAHNLNHKNNSLRLFEFGKGYANSAPGQYQESEQLCILTTGNKTEDNWQGKSTPVDLFYLKGVVNNLLSSLGVRDVKTEEMEVAKLEQHLIYKLPGGSIVGGIGAPKRSFLQKFGIKQSVYFAALDWTRLMEMASSHKVAVQPLPRFPAVQRDIAMVVSKNLSWEKVEGTVQAMRLKKLQDVRLFDVFESEKLGADKKSIAVNFTFLDTERTLTDREIDGWMASIMNAFEKDLQAEIRK